MFIGSKKIKKVETIEDNQIKVFFKDDEIMVLNKDLYNLIVRENEGNGNVSEVIGSVLGAKFLSELADYDLDISFVERIAMSMANLAHNAREAKVGELLGCKGTYDIKIKDLL